MKLGGLVYRFAYKCWRCLPEGVRQVVYRSNFLNQAKASTRDAVGRFAEREDIYNADYYALVDSMAQRSVQVMADSVLRVFDPRTAVDVGCGTGAFLLALRKRGVQVLGYEYSDAALRVCQSRGLEVVPFDLTRDSEPENKIFDVALCTEVAEHLDARFADRLVEFLVQRSRQIVFTAATPGQGGGIDHVNEQPHEYWIEKFAKQKYSFHHATSLSWREQWQAANTEACYHRNVMVFIADSP